MRCPGESVRVVGYTDRHSATLGFNWQHESQNAGNDSDDDIQ